MKRILLVVRSLQVGGVERNTVSLANALVSLGHEVHILSLKKRFDLQPISEVHVHFVDFDKINRMTGIGLIYDWITRGFLTSLIRKSGFVWRGLYIGWYFKIFIYLLERRFGRVDKIICRGQGAFEALWRLRDPRLYQVVVIPKQALSNPFLDRWYSQLLYSGKNLIANSEGVRSSLEEKFSAHSIKPTSLCLISNLCPVAEIHHLAKAPVPVPKTPYIVHVARLDYIKNQALLIRAYHRAALEEKLVIVGSGKEESRLRRLVTELGLDKRVTFVGQQTNPYPWMKHAKLFVLSSLKEGFGLVIVESLACGTPVVAVDCPGGIREILIDEQAKLIAEPTVEGLSMKIREALEKPVTINPAWVQRYDAKVIAEQFAALP